MFGFLIIFFLGTKLVATDEDSDYYEDFYDVKFINKL
jgi:hypothetical protein